jgi:hypothetical protein
MSIHAMACSPLLVAPSRRNTALAAAANSAPMYLNVRSSPADEPIRAGAACAYKAFWLASPISPCGMPTTALSATSSQAGLSAWSSNNAAQPRHWKKAPTTSLPRTRLRRPVSPVTPIAVADSGSRSRPACEALSPRPSWSHWLKP